MESPKDRRGTKDQLPRADLQDSQRGFDLEGFATSCSIARRCARDRAFIRRLATFPAKCFLQPAPSSRDCPCVHPGRFFCVFNCTSMKSRILNQARCGHPLLSYTRTGKSRRRDCFHAYVWNNPTISGDSSLIILDICAELAS